MRQFGKSKTITVPVVKRRRDWFRVMRDLMAAGISMSDVARACERATTTVQAWSEGSDPKEADARIVLALYAKHCPAEYAAHESEFAIRLQAVAKLSET